MATKATAKKKKAPRGATVQASETVRDMVRAITHVAVPEEKLTAAALAATDILNQGLAAKHDASRCDVMDCVNELVKEVTRVNRTPGPLNGPDGMQQCINRLVKAYAVYVEEQVSGEVRAEFHEDERGKRHAALVFELFDRRKPKQSPVSVESLETKLALAN